MTEALVRIHDYTPRGCVRDRLSVVSQLGRAAAVIPDGHAPFLADAVAPCGDWRTPTPDELSTLLPAPQVFAESDVLVVPLATLARVLGDHLQHRENLIFLRKAVREVTFVRAMESCIEELIPFCLRPEGLLCQGPWVSPGGMQLVTLNMRLTPPHRVGLHVDNWDDMPFLERARGRRRLCVNLGLGPRYLVFLTTPFSALVAAGLLPQEARQDVSPATLVRQHLLRNLKQLTVRLRIDPGEAYIMNADDIIHDGASGVVDVPDIALHFLGHFGLVDNPVS